MKNNFESSLISVCIINFNQGKYFDDCLNSYIFQTYKNLELIIIDDCSTDNSVQIISDLLNTHKLNANFIINKKNKGVCKNINEAIKHSKGKYLSIVASDDFYGKNRYENLINKARNTPDEYKVFFSNCATVTEQKELISKNFINTIKPNFTTIPDGDIYIELIKGNFIPAIAMLIKMEVFDDVGLFDESLQLEDYDMWLRIARKYKFKYVDDDEVFYRQVNNSHIRTLQKKASNVKETFYFFSKHIMQKDIYHRKLIMGKLKELRRAYYEMNKNKDLKFELYYQKIKMMYKFQNIFTFH